jgi:hypothetical protein
MSTHLTRAANEAEDWREQWTGRGPRHVQRRLAAPSQTRVNRLAVVSLSLSAFTFGMWYFEVARSPFLAVAAAVLGLVGLCALSRRK